MTEFSVGMGEIAVGLEGDTLTSLGLGSCVSVNLYDSVKKIAGAAHIMLPDSTGAHLVMPERTVLLAEADPNVRRQLTRILAGCEYTVTAEAKERDETLQLYRQHKPSVLLVSAFLPPASWHDTVQGLLQLDRNANVVLISPAVDRTVVLEYMNKGVQEVITDPFTEPKVISSLEYVLQKRMLKYADKAIPILKAKMIALGASERNLTAKIVGGAHMFPTIEDDQVLQIGKKNIAAVKELLAREKIPIIAEDTGAHIGRTSRFDVSTGMLSVSTKEMHKTI